MKKIIWLVFALVALSALGQTYTEHVFGKQRWGSGNSTLTRTLTPVGKASHYYLIVKADTEDVSVIWYNGVSPIDTFTVFSGMEITTNALKMSNYDIVRGSATDGYDYAFRADGQ